MQRTIWVAAIGAGWRRQAIARHSAAIETASRATAVILGERFVDITGNDSKTGYAKAAPDVARLASRGQMGEMDLLTRAQGRRPGKCDSVALHHQTVRMIRTASSLSWADWMQ